MYVRRRTLVVEFCDLKRSNQAGCAWLLYDLKRREDTGGCLILAD